MTDKQKIDLLRSELKEILEFSKEEQIPLRPQELKSIQKVLDQTEDEEEQ